MNAGTAALNAAAQHVPAVTAPVAYIAVPFDALLAIGQTQRRAHADRNAAPDRPPGDLFHRHVLLTL